MEGKLTQALKATKELRKQFKPVKAKKKKELIHQDMQDVIYKNKDELGCNFDVVVDLFSELLKEDLKKLDDVKEDEGTFKSVKNSLLYYTRENNSANGDFGIDNGESVIRWYSEKMGQCSMARYRNRWRPATDKEIREYFA